MPVFHYTALAESGAQVSGEEAAASPEDLQRELSQRGLLIQAVRRKREGIRLFGRRGARPEEFLLFNQEFMALLRAGLTLPETLELAANRPDNPGLGQVLARVLEDVRGGLVFSEACARHPDVFDRLYVSAIKTGEKTGNLAGVLARYQDYLKHRVALQKKVSQALAYPAFLLLALAVILAVLFAFVLPRFVAMYADFGAALPWPTAVLIGIVDRLPVIAPVAAVLGTAGWLGLRSWRATEAGRLRLDTFKERLPYLGGVNRAVAVAQLARALSAMLAGGTPLVEALRTAAESLSNRAYAARLTQATQRVIEGESLARAVRAQRLMPDTAVKMIEVGEAAGGLEAMLGEIAQYYEETLETRLARVMALVEPMLMLLMGLLIGGIIIVMYLPIFHMADIIK